MIAADPFTRPGTSPGRFLFPSQGAARDAADRPPRRGRTRNDAEDLPDAETDLGAAEVTLIEEEGRDRENPAVRLRQDAAAVRLHVSWPGLRRTLSAEQKEDAASPFDAESGSLSASKKLLDTKHPALRTASKVRHAAVSHWKSNSLPYPENGVRLLPRPDLPAFERRMGELQAELSDAAADVDRHRDELVSRARRRLGDLFDPADYPPSLAPLFGLSWDLPAVEPPTTCDASRPGCTSRSATACGSGSSGRWNWPSRRSRRNWPSWSSTSASG